MDRPLVRRSVHGAVRLVPMRAVREPARPEIRLKLRKAILQLCRADGFHLLDIKGAKARRIGDIPAVRQSKKLHVARRVAAAASFWLTSPVSRESSGESAFKRLDFPTPELP